FGRLRLPHIGRPVATMRRALIVRHVRMPDVRQGSSPPARLRSPLSAPRAFGRFGRLRLPHIAEARAARDQLAEQLGSRPARQPPATVTAGYNIETGEVAARASGSGRCAEDWVVDALGGDPSKVRFTEACRPRANPPPYREIPVCTRCEGKYGRAPFPEGT